MTKTEILKTIRAHCIDCCCDQPNEVALCCCPSCNLYHLRFGKDPYARVLSPEEKAKRAAVLITNRENWLKSKANGGA